MHLVFPKYLNIDPYMVSVLWIDDLLSRVTFNKLFRVWLILNQTRTFHIARYRARAIAKLAT